MLYSSSAPFLCLCAVCPYPSCGTPKPKEPLLALTLILHLASCACLLVAHSAASHFPRGTTTYTTHSTGRTTCNDAVQQDVALELRSSVQAATPPPLQRTRRHSCQHHAQRRLPSPPLLCPEPATTNGKINSVTRCASSSSSSSSSRTVVLCAFVATFPHSLPPSLPPSVIRWTPPALAPRGASAAALLPP